MNIINWLAFAVQLILMVLFPIGLAIFFKHRFHVCCGGKEMRAMAYSDIYRV